MLYIISYHFTAGGRAAQLSDHAPVMSAATCVHGVLSEKCQIMRLRVYEIAKDPQQVARPHGVASKYTPKAYVPEVCA
jgi:hypothetical protein